MGVTVSDAGDNVVRTIQAPRRRDRQRDHAGRLHLRVGRRDDGAPSVPDGTYTLKVTATNGVGTVSLAKTVTVDSTGPTVTRLGHPDAGSPNPTWTPATRRAARGRRSPSARAATGSVKFTLTGVTQRTINVSIPSAAQYTVMWDGTMNDLTTPAPAGDYRAKVYFTDKVGNAATTYPVQSDIFTIVR